MSKRYRKKTAISRIRWRIYFGRLYELFVERNVVLTPWLSFPAALVIAALVTIGTMSLFTTDAGNIKKQDENETSTKTTTSESELSLLEVLKNGKANQQIAAIFKLAESPKDLSRVVPAIGKAGVGQNEMVRTTAALAIKKIGSPASEFVEELWDSGDGRSKTAAAFIVQHLGVDAKKHLPKISAGLKSDDVGEVMASLFAMTNMGKSNLPYVDDLNQLLKHKEFNVQVGVCRIAERMGADAMPMQDALVELLNDGVLSARSWAAIALGAIGPSEKHDVVELLNAKLSAFTQVEKERALMGLAYIGPKASAALEEVKRLMNDSSKSTQAQAALTYFRITGDADTSVEVLKKLVGSLSYKRDAMERLAEMGPYGAKALSAVVKELKSDEADVRELAVIAIGKMGPDAKSAIPKLKAMLNDSDRLLVQAVEESLQNLKAANTKK